MKLLPIPSTYYRRALLCSRNFLLLVIVTTAATLRAGITSEGPVFPGEGVAFSQVDYGWTSDPDTNSNTGQIDLNSNMLLSVFSASSGYLNVSTSDGWVVQNLPVISGMSDLSSEFKLPGANGIDETSLIAAVQFSVAPVTSFSGGSTANFGVGNAEFDGEGDGADPTSGTPAAPSPNAINFTLAGITAITLQANHPNIQAADNQCAPASFANNLKWLSTTYGLPIPNANGTGLKGDNTLVGQLDTTMNRTVVSRASGQPVDRTSQVSGLLQYLTNVGDTGVIVKNEGTTGGNVNGGTMTSQGQGAAVSFNFILSEIQAGHAVQMSENFTTGGGHSVEVTGAGTILGANWVTFVSDHAQSDVDPTDTLGTGQVDFSFINSTNNIVDSGAGAQVTFVVSETVPEPSTIFGLTFGLLLFGGQALRRRWQRCR